MAATRAAVAAIAATVADITPDLDLARPGAADLNGEVLLLNPTTAAQAAKLRQAVPRLLAVLHQEGTKVNEIRLRVQPPNPPASDQVLTEVNLEVDAAQNDRRLAAARFARELAARLPESPLRTAAEQMQRRLTEQSKR
jgi:hypothetical protein